MVKKGGNDMSASCSNCGAALFELIPGTTTSLELKAFVDSSPVYAYADIQREGSGPVLNYCPNGCAQDEETEFEGDGVIPFFFDENYEKSLTARILLDASSIDLDGYKIYVDGNIEGAGNRDKDAYGRVSFSASPGGHRIVVREYEVRESGRLESDTIHFLLDDYDQIEFLLTENAGIPILTRR